jgi:aminopeptidase N
MRTEAAQPVRLSDYRPPDFLIDTVHLDVRLHDTATRVVAKLALRPNPAGKSGAALALDGDELTVKAVRLDGAALDLAAVASPQKLTIATPPAGPFTLEIETEINPSANTKLMGLFRSNGTYCTQCEAEGFRRITYFLDRPDVLSIYTTRIEADAAETPKLLSNGNRVEAGELDGGRHYAVWHDPHPKPSYLFALVGGDLGSIHETFVTKSGRHVELAIHVEKDKELRADYAMDSLIRSMKWDEEVYGREYDLDVFNVVAVSDFNMGAMENKGLNVFNDKYVLALPETATDADYAGIEAVIAHEYFHNWTGNRITCRDWFQLCLKEGLTVFRDHEFSADMRSRPVRRISEVRALRSAQFPEDAGPLAHNVRPEQYAEINNFYTATIYEKGSEVIRMLKTLIGDEAFYRGMTLYFDRHDGTAATVEQFVSCFAESSDRDLSQFFRWYTQAGTPTLRASSNYDASARTLTLDLEQETAPTPGQPVKEPVVIPVAFGLVGRQGETIAAKTGARDGASAAELAHGVLELSTPQRRIVFTDVAHDCVPSLLRGFSAPVRLASSLGEADLVTLMRHDSDSFNRWQAAQTYATRLLTRSVERIRAGELPPQDEAFADALGVALDEAERDPAFIAQVMTLPGEADLAREIGENIDPEAIFAARDGLRVFLGRRLSAKLVAVYERLTDAGPYRPDAAGAGRRALRNAALDLYAAGDHEGGSDIAMHQFQTADNMTNQFAALSVLSTLHTSQRERALDSFFRSHAGDALVLDKWFALQATIPEPATLDRVRRLMKHHAFALTNPNRVRSLIGTFAMANQTQFNAEDGSGFAFLADIVLTLDKSNPQVGARMLQAFRSWRALEPGRRAKAEAELRRIAAADALSPDVRDIIDRSLA